MDRVSFLVMMALALLWQSNCLEITNGALVNRCGLWQRFTGQPMTIAMGAGPQRSEPVVIERERVIEKTITVEKPTIIYRDAPQQQPAPPQVIYLDRAPQRFHGTTTSTGNVTHWSTMTLGAW